MKKVINSFIVTIAGALIISGCHKVGDLPVYSSGVAPVLTVSKNAVTAMQADSNTSVLTVNWTSPAYANDSSTSRYIVQIDSAGRNFTKATSKVIIGNLTTSFTGNDLNNILLNFGVAPGNTYNLDVRVISSYNNNNERHNSNTVNISVTPFSEPSMLTSTTSTVTGSATTSSQNALTFNWDKSFKSYSGIVTYTIQYDSATKNFASLQEITAGPSVYSKDLTQKSINEAALGEDIPAGNTGKLEFRIKAVTALGAVVYSNVVPVTVNTYIPYIDYQFPMALWVAGNYQGWDPPSAPKIVDPAATGATGTNYEGYINFTDAAPEFKLVKGNNWGAGDFGSPSAGQLSNGGDNIKLTDGAGVYLLKANTATMTFSAVKITTWGIIGSATPNGWDASTAMTLNANGTYTITTALTGGNELKFRANNDWGINFGDNKANGGPDNIPDYNGDNIAITASGNYLITLNITVGGNYKYTLKKL